MRLEQAWYESSPFLYLAAGSAAALDSRGSLLLGGSGLILIVLAATVIGLRWVYRQGTVRAQRNDLDESRYVSLITQDLFFDDAHASRIPRRGGQRRALRSGTSR